MSQVDNSKGEQFLNRIILNEPSKSKGTMFLIVIGLQLSFYTEKIII